MNLAQAFMSYANSGGKNLGGITQALTQQRRQRMAAAALPAGDGEGGGSGGVAPQRYEPAMVPRGGGVVGSGLGARAVRAGATQLGKPYVFGSGPDTSSFDCSDLVQWAYKQVGVTLPRDTYGQMRVLPPKPWSQLQVGDPIYRRNGGHVVLYAGNGRVLAAPHTGTNVQYEPLSYFPPSEYQPHRLVKPK